MSGVRLLDYWSPPDGAGNPLAVLATSFTFEADFFAQDCLSRFLSLSTVIDGADEISTIAALIEEEDRLNEAQVTVLIDRSSPAEKRNLRWDVLPVSVPGGLLHAKVAVLLWERAGRIVIGSANLTSAGYRRQIETAIAFDLLPDCRLPRPVLDDFIRELRALLALVPGPAEAAKARAASTIDLLEERIRALDLPLRQSRDVRLAIAPAAPGICPLDRLNEVWMHARPLWGSVLSPFWDGYAPSPAIAAVKGLVTGRPAGERELVAVIARDPINGALKAPDSLTEEKDLTLAMLDPPDDEIRTLHAKVLLLESPDWIAAMIGSSNATQAGYGLHPTQGHQELNLWIGCPVDSAMAEVLRSLISQGEAIELTGDDAWAPLTNDDEPVTPRLPDGFAWCTVHGGTEPVLSLELQSAGLPASWQIFLPDREEVLSATKWREADTPASVSLELLSDILPPYLVVRWEDSEGRKEATWPANIDDPASLPPPRELAELPVEVLLSALATSRPLPAAVELVLRRKKNQRQTSGKTELDPHKRFDNSRLLLQRTRELSLALWRLNQRLQRPVSTVEVLKWRLHGALGPVAIANGLLEAAQAGRTLPGEAHFLMAELALTIAGIDWAGAAPSIDVYSVHTERGLVIEHIRNCYRHLPSVNDTGLAAYVERAFAEATQ